MDHNPYSAPRSALTDVGEPRGKRPPVVGIAVMLLATAIAFSVRDGVLDFRGVETGEISGLMMVWRVLRIALAVLLCLQIARGRNWARHGELVFVALGAARFAFEFWNFNNLPEGVHLMLDPVQVAIRVIPLVLELSALYLLFVPGRHWFKRRAV
jgi:hypothetical protein